MPADSPLLIIDPSERERERVRADLAGEFPSVITASDPAEAFELTRELDGIGLLVAAIDRDSGSEAFDFRDHLLGRMEKFPSAFCSAEDMTPFYDRVVVGERLFYKPLDTAGLIGWFRELAAADGNSSPADGTGQTAEEGAAAATAASPAPTADPSTADADSAGATDPAPGAGVGAEDPTSLIPPPEDPADLPEGSLPEGARLGDYRLLRLIQEDSDFALYEAEQTSIGRKVALKILFRKHRKEMRWVQGFVDEASARASVNHPAISLVYECDQETGVNFYTLELVDAPSLADLARRRERLDDRVLWGIIESTASALAYLRDSGMTHRLISSQTILLVSGEHARIANPVKGRGDRLTVAEETHQMRLLGDAIAPFLVKGESDPALFSLVDRLGAGRIDAIKSIEGLEKALGGGSEREALSEAEIAKIEEKEKNRTAIVAGSIIGLLIVLGVVAGLLFYGSEPEIRALDEMTKVPEGEFPYQDGERVELPEFWIGKYEVTIAQYAEFLEALEANPALAGALRAPGQPAEKTSHAPERWAEMREAAMKGRKFVYARIDPNFPIVGIDWWDAQAYAKWRGGRLPTEQEWEKAARSRSGFLYPWGDEMDRARMNSGLDRDGAQGVKPGSIDGYSYWAPVDAFTGDRGDESRYGVIGLGGNVSEWTATTDSDPENPERQIPIKRGAAFTSENSFELTTRRAAESAGERNFWTGFRIASNRETLVPMAEPEAPAELKPEAEAEAEEMAAPQPEDPQEERPGEEPAADQPDPAGQSGPEEF